MITSVLDGNDLLLDSQEIFYVKNKDYIYFPNSKIEVGSNKRVDFEIGESYKLITVNSKEISFTYDGSNTITLDSVIYFLYIFTENETYKLINNLLDNKKKTFSLSLKKHINTSANLVNIANLELRKLGSIILLNGSKNPTIEHISSVASSNEVKLELLNANITPINEATKNNYMTIDKDNKILQTKKGNGYPIFLNTISKDEISGLDLFLTPSIKLDIIDDLSLNIRLGDKLALLGKEYFVIEILRVMAKEQLKTVITFGYFR